MSAREAFESHARDCIRIACEAKDALTREELIALARAWMSLVQASENEGLIFVQAASGFAVKVHRKGFAMVALK